MRSTGLLRRARVTTLPTSGGFDTGSYLAATRWGTAFAAVGALGAIGLLALRGAVSHADIVLALLTIVVALVARVPWLGRWAFTPELCWAACTMLVAAAIGLHPAAGGLSNMSPLAVLFPIVAVLACYFLPPLRALVQILLIAVAYATTLRMTSADVEVTGVRVGIMLTSSAILGPLTMMVRIRFEMTVLYLRDAAFRDPLTALLNRRGFERALGEAIETVQRTDAPLTLVIADVDYFKAINDRLGHRAGDDVLSEVGMMLHLFAPNPEHVARIGGEEFAVVLAGHSLDSGVDWADSLRQQVEETFEDRPSGATMSFGVAGLGIHGESIDELLHAADQALSAAKELGRNRAVGFSEQVVEILVDAHVRREEHGRTHLGTLLTLAEALDLRDASTALHSRTVAEYTEAIAIQLGLEPAMVERLRLGGLLHDIGKIGVADDVLLKPGKLTDEQWEQMRKHPQIGARMLNHENYHDIRDWVLAHHERPDGRGYPFGLGAEEIPLGARILSVADAYEAMTADRVYRKAPGHAFARQQLRECTGSQFDAEIVAAFEAILDARGIGLTEAVDTDVDDLPAAA